MRNRNNDDNSADYTAGFYNCPALANDLPQLLVEARARGATCSLGPQWDASEIWGGLEGLYPLLDVFLPNEVIALCRHLNVVHALSMASLTNISCCLSLQCPLSHRLLHHVLHSLCVAVP